MSAPAAPVPAPRTRPSLSSGGLGFLGLGISTVYLSLIVLIPLAAVVAKSDGGWSVLESDQAIAALQLSLIASLVVAAINAVFGTLIAWVLVRDSFPGKGIVNAIIDLPFALPTIVAGLTLLALYGPKSPLGVNVAYKEIAVGAALLFVTLPFVVRSVQPVLHELDRDMEAAAESLGAGPFRTFRSIVLPNLLPAILAGVGLAFARGIGEIGSLVLITGNLPFETEVASVFIIGQIESGSLAGAAAVSTVLLALALIVLVVLNLLGRWARRHDR